MADLPLIEGRAGQIVADASSGLELATAVDAIRAQFAKAAELGKDRSLQFEVGQLELEFTVTMTRDAQGHGGIRVWVLDLGGSLSQSASACQRVKVTLTTRDASTGGPVRIAESSLTEPPD